MYRKKREDIVVVGGGVAGLYVARNLAHKRSVLVLEARGEVGGRVRTVYSEGRECGLRPEEGGKCISYEAGPWRIPFDHRRARLLFDEMGVSLTPSTSVVHEQGERRHNELVNGIPEKGLTTGVFERRPAGAALPMTRIVRLGTPGNHCPRRLGPVQRCRIE